MRPKLAVTLTDVAEKADVSIATVSRIINEVGSAHEDTVDRVALEWLDGLPAVQVLGESRTGCHWFDHLGPDNAQAGALAADYLLNRPSAACATAWKIPTSRW